MSLPDPDLLARLRGLLALRQQELRALLQDAAEARAGGHSTDVQDFKDVAAEDSRAAIDQVALSHATIEMGQVSAALRRMDEGSYGACQECGEAIDERRLLALPATPFCAPCQASHERPGRGRRL